MIRLLDEEEHLRSEQKKLLNKLEQKQILSREKIEQYSWESESDNQVRETAMAANSTIKEELKIKGEKNKAEEEQKYEEERKLARGTCRKHEKNKKKNEEEEEYYCRQVHGKERQE